MTQRIFGDGKNGFSGERTRETPFYYYGNGEVSLYNSDSKRVQCTPFFLCAAEAANMTLSAKQKCAKNTENVFFRLIFWNGFNLDGGADLGFRLLFMVFRSF